MTDIYGQRNTSHELQADDILIAELFNQFAGLKKNEDFLKTTLKHAL